MEPPGILIIRSREEDKKTWQHLCQQYHLPSTMVYNIPAEQTLHASLAKKKAATTSLAYPCNGWQCLEPLKNEKDLQKYLRNNSYRVLE